ncbi:MAG TPA: gamma subclass chorismate mutase AroQ [Pirellulales bacterium]|nr:gamma subclass chorismate mutase AroQ [Pirellulales bacterium]
MKTKSSPGSRGGKRLLGCVLAAASVAPCGCGAPEGAVPPAAPAVSPARPGQSEVAVDGLLDLMRRRLALMHEVARWKWNESKPITDRDREQQLLDDLERRGLEYGLSRQRTNRFMTAQIEAGKLIQEADFAAWREQGQGKFSNARDLNSDLRPLIDDLSDSMLAQLSRLSPESSGASTNPDVRRRAAVVLRGEGIDDVVRETAVRPLLGGSQGGS